MNITINNSENSSEVETIMNDLGARAKQAARKLASAPTSQKNKALEIMAEKIAKFFVHWVGRISSKIEFIFLIPSISII